MACIRLQPATSTSGLPPIEVFFGQTKTIGRAEGADIIVGDASLSRMHARLSVDLHGGARLEDLGSTNGVFVNGAPASTIRLVHGDRVRFGLAEFTVSIEAPRADAGAGGQSILRVPLSQPGIGRVDQAVLEALLDISREMMAFDDLPALLERVLDRLQAIVKPDRLAILLADRATGELTPRAVRPPGAYTSVSEFSSSTIVREALATREVLIVHDTAEQEWLRQAASLVGAGVRSVICIPLFGRTGPIGVLYADRIGSGRDFTPQLAEYAGAFAAHVASALETATLYDDRERHFRGTLEAFARAIDARDPYTAGHSERVTAYTILLASHAALPPEEIEIVRRAGMLHDIGKVGVRDAILLKAGPLDAAERAAMEAHTTIGHRMLEGVPFLADALPSVRGHHERWDGRGYPDRLAGAAIHPHARLMAVADTYDAMTSARPYRGPIPREEARRRIAVESGLQFDPAVVESFLALEAEFHAMREAAFPV